MTIKTIEYKRLINLGNFQNMTVGAVAELEPHEDVTQAFITLRMHVDTEAAIIHRPAPKPVVEETELDEIPF